MEQQRDETQCDMCHAVWRRYGAKPAAPAHIRELSRKNDCSDITRYKAIQVSSARELPWILHHTISIYLTLGFTLAYECSTGERGSIVVKALCYKREGRGFETR
jgi:hypothetical protein